MGEEFHSYQSKKEGLPLSSFSWQGGMTNDALVDWLMAHLHWPGRPWSRRFALELVASLSQSRWRHVEWPGSFHLSPHQAATVAHELWLGERDPRDPRDSAAMDELMAASQRPWTGRMHALLMDRGLVLTLAHGDDDENRNPGMGAGMVI